MGIVDIGNPLADFAYHVMTWRVTPELFRGLAGIDFASLGIPTEEEYVAAYCRCTDRGPIPDWEFAQIRKLSGNAYSSLCKHQGNLRRCTAAREQTPRN